MAGACSEVRRAPTKASPEPDSNFAGSGVASREVEPEWKICGNPINDQSTEHDRLGFRPHIDAVAAFLNA